MWDAASIRMPARHCANIFRVHVALLWYNITDAQLLSDAEAHCDVRGKQLGPKYTRGADDGDGQNRELMKRTSLEKHRSANAISTASQLVAAG